MKAMKAFPKLPEDIIFNILSRLPVKSLIRMKSVCKSWQSLISDHHFAKLHLSQSQKGSKFSSLRVLIVTVPLESAACEATSDDDVDGNRKTVFNLDYPAIMKAAPDSDELVDESLEIAGSCNGLICIVFENGRIFLWNPTIREALELANSEDFDPKGTFFYGLGYNSSTDNYKLVRVGGASSSSTASNKTAVEILTMKTKSWRRIEGEEAEVHLHGGAGIFLQGALHWLAVRENDSKKIFVIVAFDMVEEKFYELLPIPDSIEESKYHSLCLGISGDSLCLFYGCGYETVFEAWLLKDYGIKSSWTRLYRVNRDVLHGHKYWEDALCYTETGKVVINYDGRELVWYDPREMSTKIFNPQNDWDWFHPAIYVESLVSPNHYCTNNTGR